MKEKLCCSACVKRDVCKNTEEVKSLLNLIMKYDIAESGKVGNLCDRYDVYIKIECTKYVREKNS